MLVAAGLGILAPRTAFAANPVHLVAALSGDSVVGSSGASHGHGVAGFDLYKGQGKICYTVQIIFLKTDGAKAAVYQGKKGKVGPVVVPLAALDSHGHANACITGVNKLLVAAIAAHPKRYYVQVSTSEYPNGAVRGQLHKPGS
jgi:hypothetical protein